MVLTSDMTAATATGDTTETSVGTIAFSKSASKLVGIGCYACVAAALTTAESVSGIFRVTLTGKQLGPAKWPLAVVNVLTSGAIAFEPKIWPLQVSDIGNRTLEFLVTCDMANTGALKARGIAIFEEAVS